MVTDLKKALWSNAEYKSLLASLNKTCKKEYYYFRYRLWSLLFLENDMEQKYDGGWRHFRKDVQKLFFSAWQEEFNPVLLSEGQIERP